MGSEFLDDRAFPFLFHNPKGGIIT
jgi:hypothetical protein